MNGLFWIGVVLVAGGLFLAVGVALARLEMWLEDVTGWRMFPDDEEFEDDNANAEPAPLQDSQPEKEQMVDFKGKYANR